MIELRDVRYRYPGGGDSCALDGLNLEVREGESVLVAGASGSGKSTLAYILSGLIPHLLGGELAGQVLVAGKDVRACKPAELFPSVGLVLQNADAQLFNPTVEEELAFGLESLGIPEEDIRDRVGRTAERFGIEHLLGRSPSELSGGEKRLVGIASLASMPSPTLVLDEPLAHLDESSLARLTQALHGLRAEGRTIIIVEHRVQPLLEEVDRCLILEHGRVSFEGAPGEARVELTRRGLIPTYPTRFPSELSPGEVVLEVEGLHKSLGGRQVLGDISFELREGETLAVLGPNGAGKTTLIRHLNGLLRPDKGRVLLRGEPLARKDPAEVASQVGVVFQNPNDQFFRARVKEEILAGPASRWNCPHARLQEICSTLGLTPLLERSPYRLSEGEKRRVAMASVLAMGSRILVMDEPTAGQDGRCRMELARLMAGLQAERLSLLIVTHDRAFAGAVADRCLEMEGGKIKAPQQAQRRAAGWGR